MRPNIVFFFSDQQRFDSLSCNGQKLPVSPNIDKAAANGINFINTFTVQPVCGPARACLQTGLYPTQVGCFRNGVACLQPDQKTLAKYLNEAGYKTAYVGKWHLACDKENNYEKRPVPVERRGGYKDYWMAADVLEFTSHGYDGHLFNADNEKVEFKGYRTDCVTDFAVDFIQSTDDKTPFFLFISNIEPHHQNDRNRFEGPEGSKERWKGYEKPDDLEPGKGDWEEAYEEYLGCCNALDNNFGKVVEALKEKGIYENTLLIYTSDHGCHFQTLLSEVSATGFDDYKRNSFENTIHIPLIVTGPGFKGGVRNEELVSLIDLPKTILKAAGCTGYEDNMQGEALQDIIAGKAKNEEVYIQISESYVGRVIRNKRFKYVVEAKDKDAIHDSGSDVYTEKYLFDIETDKLEKNNLIHNKNYDQIRAQMRERMIVRAEEAGEPFRIL